MIKFALIIVLNTVIFWGCFFISGTAAGITVTGTKCGQRICQLTEYCSSFDNTCKKCSTVCDTKSHNYEEDLCEKQCQDYLHDMRYVKLGDGKDNGDLRATVSALSRMVTITLTLVILMLVVLMGLLCFQLYRWKVKKNITLAVIRRKLFKKNDSPNAEDSTPQHQDNKKRDLRLEIPSPTVNSDHSPVTVSTSIDRRPAEDSALDYAYDNPAMTKSHNSSY